MSEEVAVYTADHETTAIAKPNDLDTGVLKEFLTSWKQGGGTVTTFTANGIQYIAQELGISIVSSDFKETSNGGYYFTAEAKNLHTGQSYVTHIYQPSTMKRGGKEVFDPDAIAKGSTRVARNAMSALIPVQVLKHRVQAAIRAGEVSVSEIMTAQKEARSAMETRRADLKTTFGVTPGDAFEIAQARLGSADEWAAEDWQAFTKAVQELDGDWFE